MRGGAAAAGAGDGADGDGVVAQADEDLRRGAHQREAAEVEIDQERRRVDPPQRAVEREGRQGERRLEALGEHHLEDVAGADVLLRPLHHLAIGVRRGIGLRRHDLMEGVLGRQVGQGAVQRRADALQPLARLLVGCAGGDARLRPHRRDEGDLVAHGVEHHHRRRADEDRVRHAEDVGLGLRQAFHLPDHVVAEIAEHARRHGRGALRQMDARFLDQLAQRDQRLVRAGLERVGIGGGAPVDLGGVAAAAPDHVRLDADHRVAPARGAALHGFEQEAVRLLAGDLEEGRDRRLKVGDQRGRDHLRLAARIGAREVRFVGCQAHAWSPIS